MLKTVKRDKGRHYILIKVSIHQGDITIIDIYAHNIKAYKYMKQTLAELKEEIDSNTIIVEDFNTWLSITGRTIRQKINKETAELNNPINQRTSLIC